MPTTYQYLSNPDHFPYDPFFKHLFDPQSHPERLFELSFLLLEEPVAVIQILDSGILDMLQEYLYAKLGKFRETVKALDTRLLEDSSL